MLLLASNGLTSAVILNELHKHTEGGTAALVVTADNIYKDRNHHVPRSREELTRLGFTVDLLDIDTVSPARLLDYDLVEFIGGNPFYLLDSIHRNEAEPVLEKLANEKLLIGWSAAAMVFGPTLALANEYTPEMNTVGLADLSGLGLTDVTVLPHYSRFLKKYDRFEERCALFEEKSGRKVLRLNDGDGVFIESGQMTLVRA